MSEATLGVVARSRKPDERRLAIHPRHLAGIEESLRRRIFLEHGYGEAFGVPDEELRGLVGGLAGREEIMAGHDVVLLPKPLVADLRDLPEGRTLWGWPHCVQDRELTQVAIDRRLTLIAFEAMNRWSSEGPSACTCSTATTRWPATPRCSTPCSSSGPPATSAGRCAPRCWGSEPPAVVR